MTSLRKYYVFAAAVFAIGAALAIYKGEATSVVVFLILTAMMAWIAVRVGRADDPRQSPDRDPDPRAGR